MAIDLGTLGGGYSQAGSGANYVPDNCINELGQVVGASETASGDIHAFFWSEETGMVDIGHLGGRSHANAINNLSEVVGISKTEYPNSGYTHCFRWTAEDGIEDIGTLNAPTCFAFDINDLGQVVGVSEVYPGVIPHAFLWENGKMIDLNELIPEESGWFLWKLQLLMIMDG